jgi:tetratricopeptide (TPR) repeat protein
MWENQQFDEIPIAGLISGYIAKQLAAVCPDHPTALANLIVNDWVHTRDRAAEIERNYGGHPQVALSLARAYRREKRTADAIRLLDHVVKLAPDRTVYEQLAACYREQRDDAKWLATWQAYLEDTEDFGLDHATVTRDITYTLMRNGRAKEALQYAKIAGDSFSEWGLEAYANCLTELGRYADAEQVVQASQKRYPPGVAWYTWCQITGKGDLAAARTDAAAAIEALSDVDQRDVGVLGEWRRARVFYALEGRIDQARALWRDRGSDAYSALQLAMLEFEQDKPEAALVNAKVAKARTASMANSLGNSPNAPPELKAVLEAEQERDRVYRIGSGELIRCLEDPKATPRRDGEMKSVLESVQPEWAANIAYFMGRTCELRGKTEEAKAWYRDAMKMDFTFACRSQTAVALRRLGDEYYK